MTNRIYRHRLYRHHRHHKKLTRGDESKMFVYFVFVYYVDRVPQGLEDVSKYPYLFAELLESDRWSEEDIAKLAGKNLIRVFKQVEQVSLFFDYFF